MSKKAFDQIMGGLQEAALIAPYLAQIQALEAELHKTHGELWRAHVQLDWLRRNSRPLKDAKPERKR